MLMKLKRERIWLSQSESDDYTYPLPCDAIKTALPRKTYRSNSMLPSKYNFLLISDRETMSSNLQGLNWAMKRTRSAQRKLSQSSLKICTLVATDAENYSSLFVKIS